MKYMSILCVLLAAASALPAQHDDTPTMSEILGRMEQDLETMKRLTAGRPETADALRKIQSGLTALRAERDKNPEPQILIESRFIEMDEEASKRLRLDRNIRLTWEGGRGVATKASQADIDALKRTGNSLSAPSLLVNNGGKAVVETREAREVDYLEKQSDNTYVMKTKNVDDGLRFNLRARIADKDGKKMIRIDSGLRTTSIVGRTPFERGAQFVGMPLVSSRESEFSLTVSPGTWFLVPATRLESGTNALLLVAIRATLP